MLIIIVHLGDQNNPEDCDGDVGGEKEIETDREKTIQQSSNNWRLQSNYQSTQHANVLQEEIKSISRGGTKFTVTLLMRLMDVTRRRLR